MGPAAATLQELDRICNTYEIYAYTAQAEGPCLTVGLQGGSVLGMEAHAARGACGAEKRPGGAPCGMEQQVMCVTVTPPNVKPAHHRPCALRTSRACCFHTEHRAPAAPRRPPVKRYRCCGSRRSRCHQSSHARHYPNHLVFPHQCRCRRHAGCGARAGGHGHDGSAAGVYCGNPHRPYCERGLGKGAGYAPAATAMTGVLQVGQVAPHSGTICVHADLSQRQLGVG